MGVRGRGLRESGPRLEPRGQEPVSDLANEARQPMATDFKNSVAPSTMPESVNAEIERVLESGLGELSLRELIGLMLSSLGDSEV